RIAISSIFFLPITSVQASFTLRSLHSFPTRRSSDLLHFRRERGHLAHRFVGLVLERPEHSFHAGGQENDRDPVILHPAERSALADRKSTRLNSSHSQISYAVFCLKKKNTPTAYTTQS